MYALIVGFLMLWIKYDSPKYHMSKNERSLSLKSIHQIYQTKGSTKSAYKIYNFIKKTSTSD